METGEDKRAYERHGYAAEIAFSYFNNEHSYDAEIINLCVGGICFKSDLWLQPGATVCIRLKQTNPNGPYCGPCEGLRTVTLGEVRWCSELPDAPDQSYGVGVKYFNPVY